MVGSLVHQLTEGVTIEELETHLSINKKGVDLVKARRIIERVKQLTENRIQAYYDASVENLNALQVAPEKLTILKEVCDHLMHRQS